MLLSLATLSTALLFGGMTRFSFGFAAVLFKSLPAVSARAVLRQTFPWFYAFVIAAAGLSAALWWPLRTDFAGLMAAVALSTLPIRPVLMPAIHRATDTGNRRHFQVLHSLSVLLTLAHIAVAGWLLAVVA